MLVVPLLAASILSQEFIRRFAEPPDLAIGQKIKVTVAEPVRVTPVFMTRTALLPRSLTGILTAYRPPESITVRSTGWIAGLGPRNERSVDWSAVMGIQVPKRRNALNAVEGAIAGFGAAVGFGLSLGLFDSVFCGAGGNRYCRDRNAWYYTKRLAPFAIPIGTVAGLLSERWRRVY
jgi:hypothetical protein